MVLRVRTAWARPLRLGVHRGRATGLMRHPRSSRRRQGSGGRGAAPGDQHSPASSDHHGATIIRFAVAARDSGQQEQEEHGAHQSPHGVGGVRHERPVTMLNLPYAQLFHLGQAFVVVES